MDEANTAKGKAKNLVDDLRTKKQLTVEKEEQLQVANLRIKTIAAKAVEAFKQIDEYNIVFFSWYYKGFELLRRYLVKHLTSVNLGSLDLEKVDKEMETNKASQSMATALEGNAPETTPTSGDEVDA